MDERERNQRFKTYERWIAEWEAAAKACLDAGLEESADQYTEDISDLRSWMGTVAPISITGQAAAGRPVNDTEARPVQTF